MDTKQNTETAGDAGAGQKLIHVCHVIHRLEYGGLQNGLVNLVNGLNDRAYRHTILCLTDATDYRWRITAPNTEIVEIGKKPGKDPAAYGRVWRALRRLKPDIVHTRNISAVDMIFVAKLAGVPAVVHSEHGLDVLELDGSNPKYNRLRRWTRPFVDCFVTMSADLARWLMADVGVPSAKVQVIYNGVDTGRFAPGPRPSDLAPVDFLPEDPLVIGMAGRLAAVKDPLTLARAFIRVLELRPAFAKRLRLVILGDGPLKVDMEAVLMRAKVSHLAWFAGYREETPDFYRLMDVFVLPSKREGISNTLLEAQATGLPVIATDVGGNPEIVAKGRTGFLMSPGDPQAMAEGIVRYIEEPALAKTHGEAARARAVKAFSLSRMIGEYDMLYRQLTPRV